MACATHPRIACPILLHRWNANGDGSDGGYCYVPDDHPCNLAKDPVTCASLTDPVSGKLCALETK